MKNLNEKFVIRNGVRENKEPIKNLREYLKIIEDLRQYWRKINLWYRGVPKSEYDLKPSIYRDNDWKYSLKREISLNKDYRRKSYPHLKSRDFSIWELYELMQHYGTPTRLLDWSQGSLIALLFAILDEKKCKRPAIWVLDPHNLNQRTTNEAVVYYTMHSDDKRDIMAINKYLDINKIFDLPEYPIAVLPPLIDSRIVAQKSCFTIHGRNINGFEKLLEKDKDLRLVKLIISDICIEHIKYELATTGLTNTSIFPDLEGLSKDLKYEHRIK